MGHRVRELSIPTWVLSHKDLFFDERFVLGVLHALNKIDWKLKLSNEQIGKLVGMPGRSVGYCLKHLERDGYIRIRHAGKSYREIWLTSCEKRRAA